MAILTLNILGTFEASLDGEKLIKFRTNKVQALLIYLVTEARLTPDRLISHRREFLMELFWPESSLKSAQDNLRQTLYQLRKALPELTRKDGKGSSPLLITTHQALSVCPDCEINFDVENFVHLLKGQPSLTQLEKAAELYRGDFLADFFLPDCNEFENWIGGHRAEYRRQILTVLATLADVYIHKGKYEDAQESSRRQIEIDNLNEKAHRQLMRALAFDQNRNAALAHYEECKVLFNQELGVEPSDETTNLYEQIRSQNLIIPPGPAIVIDDGIGFAENIQNHVVDTQIPEKPVFVVREFELEQLRNYLEISKNGQGKVVFITGSAGMGKTSLMREFAQQGIERNPDLLVAIGNCNSYSGVGDPYLPFREIITMLMGLGIERIAELISIEHTRRLLNSLPLSIDSLIENGQHMIDIFVSGNALVSQAAAVTTNNPPWYQRLIETVQNQKTNPSNLEQSQLFNQFFNTLHAISLKRPLLLILDDVQWADIASISLLFHIGRRLSGSRILILCAYRSDEITLGRDGNRHPLEKILSEFKRQFGDVWIDLSNIEEKENRRFVDALLETAPNLLGQNFRASLFKHTQGHPLFTVELLRAMEDRGDLIKDENGRWVQGPTLDWNTLPARVEAAIGERINRLSDELKETLTIASVEGEVFTAQVVAHIQGLSEKEIYRLLSQQLDKRHHLVIDGGEKQVGNYRLGRYQFSHVLIQQYLYNNLSLGERRIIHKEIAVALEKFYHEQEEEIAVQLVRHYAGDRIREQNYSRLAGERAAKQYANEEAVRFLSRALELTEADDYEEQIHLLLIREEVFDTLGHRENQKKDLDWLENLVDLIDSGDMEAKVMKAKVALRKANYAHNISDFSSAIESTKIAVAIAETIDEKSILAAGHLQWGECLWRLADLSGAQSQFQKALNLAQEIEFQQIEADSMRLLGNICYYQGDYTGAIAYQGPSLFISREIGDRSSEASALSNLGEAFRSQGDYIRAKNYYEQRLRICREIGERLGEDIALNNLSLIAHTLGENEIARDYALLALEISKEIENRSFQSYNLTNLGHALAGLEKFDEAITAYQKAAEIRREIGEEHLAIESIAGLAEVYFVQGNQSEAQTQVNFILNFLESGNLEGTEEPLRIYLTCFHVLSNSDPDQAYDLLNTGHYILQEQVKKIVKDEYKRLFLENVRVNREIVDEWQMMKSIENNPGD